MDLKRKGLFFILVLGLTLVGVLGYQTFAVRNAMAAANSPVGSWTVTVTPDDGPPFTNGGIFSSDGTVTIMEADGTLGLGVWEKLSGNQYAFTFWEYYSQDGSSIQVKVSSTFKLINDKEQYVGPFSVQIFDGINWIVVGSGTATGVRNHVEPMP
jgi:hypothetical protein